MCVNCDEIILRKSFYSLRDYFNCIEYIKNLVQDKKYELIESTCDFDRIKNENGCWVDDIIIHKIKCSNCGKIFICHADTYHGTGEFNNDIS